MRHRTRRSRRVATFVALLLAACDGSHPSAPPQPPPQPPTSTQPQAPWPATLTDRRDGFVDFARVVVTSGSNVYRHGITLFKSGKFYDWADGAPTFSDCVLCTGYGSYEIKDTTIVLRFEFMYWLHDSTNLPTEIIGSIKGDTLRFGFPRWMWGVSDVYMDNGPYALNHRLNFP